jgi:hypothetical protein
MPDAGVGDSYGGESVGSSNPYSPSDESNVKEESSDENDENKAKEKPSTLDKGKRKATEQEVLEQERKRARIDPP